MPQGLSTSPASFTRLAMAIMADLISAGNGSIYLDDWLMCSKTFSEHITLLRTVFTRLRTAGLKFRLSKSQLCQKEILYLGHILSAEGISVAPHNTEKIRKFPRPKNLTEVRRLCGLFSYYRNFCQGFAKIIEPINNLTKKDVPFAWTDECEQAAERLKDIITHAPVLAFPNFKEEFLLTTDAAAVSLGGVLEQRQEDWKIHPISYFSRTLNAAERKWDACQLELLAIVQAVKFFRPYLLNVPFKIFTDNVACTYILNKTDLTPKLARWAVQLSEYQFEVHHKKGRLNRVTDALSRVEIAAITDEPLDDIEERQQVDLDMR